MGTMAGIKCVLLDIEGTICPISFVKDTLFPYALNALPDILATKWDSEEFKSYRNTFPESAQASQEEFKHHVEDLTKRDVKIAYLKDLQGYLWETGYKTGAYSTPLFPDVAPQLKTWSQSGINLVIYSSGSVFAQKLLFGHIASEHGAANLKRKRENQVEAEVARDLDGAPAAKKLDSKHYLNGSSDVSTPALPSGTVEQVAKKATDLLDHGLDGHERDESTQAATEDLQYLIDDWFDTTNAGLKQDSQSYEKIARALELPTTDVLFLSDNVKEVDAALAAGMSSIVVDRPGNAPLAEADKSRLRVVNSLDQVSLGQVETKEDGHSLESKTKPGRRSERLRTKGSTAE